MNNEPKVCPYAHWERFTAAYKALYGTNVIEWEYIDTHHKLAYEIWLIGYMAGYNDRSAKG